MVKNEFISEICAKMRELGYKKRGNYWYKAQKDLLLCINVQGSQWNKDNYYVEIGASIIHHDLKNPTVLGWYFRHRCKGQDGKELNILPRDFFQCIENTFSNLTSADQLPQYLAAKNAQKIVNQYRF